MTEALFEFPSATPADAKPDYSVLDKHLVVLDGNNLAVRTMHVSKGDPGLLVHMFMTQLGRYLRELKPTHFLCTWDGGRSFKRETIFPDYKLARRLAREDAALPDESSSGFKGISECLTLLGIAQHREEGAEADDLIAAAHRCFRAKYPDALVTIMSSDKDLLQLLDEHTQQLRFSSYGTPTDMWTRQRVITDLGYTPEQIPAVMAFTGDQSDGVPGAKGIGPVKAVKLLKQHDWDWDAAAATLPDHEMVQISWHLVDLLGDLACQPFEDIPAWNPLTRHSPYATQRLELFTDFAARFQLKDLWAGVIEGTLW